MVGGFGGLQICRNTCIQPGAKLTPTAIKIHQQIDQLAPQIHPKSAKWCPKAARKRSWKEVASRTALGGYRLMLFWWVLGATWATLGATSGPAGRQGVPKSSLLASRCAKKSKNEVPERVPEKALNYDRKFDGKCEVRMPRIIDFTAVLQWFFDIHDFQKKLKKH